MNRTLGWTSGDGTPNYETDQRRLTMPMGNIEMRDDGTGPVDEWPTCPECGGILNFAGECPNGHRMREILGAE